MKKKGSSFEKKGRGSKMEGRRKERREEEGSGED